MLKFLRRYQAWIMAVGGSLLMVAFLLPQAIQRFGTMTRNQPAFRLTVDGREVTVSGEEYQRAGSEMAILEAMFNARDIGPLLNFPAYDSENPTPEGLHGVDHWIMLKREAQLAGLIGGPADGDFQLQQQASTVSQQQRVPFEDVYSQLIQILGSEARQSGMSLDEGKQAFATLAGIGRLIDKYAASAVASDNRVRHIVDQFEDRINIAFVFVDATEFIDELPVPDEALLLEQFEKYRDVEPGAGEKGFGYRLGDRAKVEYLTIKYQSLLDQVEASGLEARKWFQRNQDLVRPNADGSRPTYDEFPDDVIAAYRRAKAEELMAEISRTIKGELLSAIQPLPRDGAFRVLPEGWVDQRVSFEALRERLQEQFGVTVEYSADAQSWKTMSELGTLEGIGGATRPAGVANMSFRQLVEGHREIARTPLPGLQAGIADTALLRRNDFNRGRVGESAFPADAFLYRVIEIDRARAAETLDEVREQVVKDVKRLQAYDTLVADIDAWWRRGIDEGIDDLAKSIDSYVRRGAVARYGNTSSEPGDYGPNAVAGITSQTLVDAVFARTDTFESLTRYADLPMEQRLLTTPVPERLGIAVVRLERHFPTTRERWLNVVDGGMRVTGLASVNVPPSQVLMYRDFGDTQMKPYMFDAMKARMKYVDLRDDSSTERSADGIGEPTESN